MDWGEAAPSGGSRKHVRRSAGTASDKERAEARKVAVGETHGSAQNGRRRSASQAHATADADRLQFDAGTVEGGTVDGAGRDGLDRAAEVLSGAGHDKPTTEARLSLVGQLPELPADRYLDREESWLRFAQRVLELAEDPDVPLLERVRFESIFASALDEFFMVRVAGRIRRMATGLPVESVSGKPPDQILEHTLIMARDLAARHALCFSDGLLPAHRATPSRSIPGLPPRLPVLAADPRPGLTLSARVKVPPLLPRFLPASPSRFVPLEDVIAAHLNELFAGLDVIEHHAFRVTRIRDLEIDEDVTENLLHSLDRDLMRRRFEPAVSLEVEESISTDVLEKLVAELDVDHRPVYRLPGPLDLPELS